MDDRDRMDKRKSRSWESERSSKKYALDTDL